MKGSGVEGSTDPRGREFGVENFRKKGLYSGEGFRVYRGLDFLRIVPIQMQTLCPVHAHTQIYMCIYICM